VDAIDIAITHDHARFLPFNKDFLRTRSAAMLAFCPKNRHLTKYLPDKWESARFRSIFLALSFFYISNIIHARPIAGNVNG
jgi:hypothetical protein